MDTNQIISIINSATSDERLAAIQECKKNGLEPNMRNIAEAIEQTKHKTYLKRVSGKHSLVGKTGKGIL